MRNLISASDSTEDIQKQPIFIDFGISEEFGNKFEKHYLNEFKGLGKFFKRLENKCGVQTIFKETK